MLLIPVVHAARDSYDAFSKYNELTNFYTEAVMWEDDVSEMDSPLFSQDSVFKILQVFDAAGIPLRLVHLTSEKIGPNCPNIGIVKDSPFYKPQGPLNEQEKLVFD